MAATPQINNRNSVGQTTQLVYSTNQDSIVLTGTVGASTVALQVSINGGAYTTDSTLIELDGTDWTFPSSSNWPDGYALPIGQTVLSFRAIDIVGAGSAVATATITRVASAGSAAETLIPTGVQVRRHFDYVQILATVPVPDPSLGVEFRGFNFFASTEPSGGSSGYARINKELVTTTAEVEDIELADLDEVQTDFDAGAVAVRLKVTQEDVFGNTVSTHLNKTVDVGTIADPYRIRLSTLLQSARTIQFIGFNHDRRGSTDSINSDLFIDTESTDPLYYVVTAVFWNPTLQAEFETPYSQEILGSPLTIDTTLRNLPGRRQIDIIQSFISQVQRVNKEISLIPGNTTRDVSCDPFASEAQRIWFIVDFSHRCQSLPALMQLDDANGDRISDDVATSSYKIALKSALGLQSDQAVQRIIDLQFDRLCSNWVKPRLSGRAATVDLVLYRKTRPTADIPISGLVATSDPDLENSIPALRYVIGGTYLLPAADADAYYSFERQRYEIVVSAVAEQIGSIGNRPAKTIKSLSTSIGGLSCENLEAASLGKDRESNAEFAERAQLAYVSLDTGTEGGLKGLTAGRPSIVKSRIIKSGDSLMMRDWDPVRKKHIGGKVDVWVQGKRERTITETFAFQFAESRDVRCQIIDPTNLIFRVLEPALSVSTPLIEVLDNSTHGLGVRNATLGADYDVTGVTILDYQTFQLDNSLTQPATALDDIIRADIRYRSVNRFVPTVQPVRRVTSVVGESSGSLTSSGFTLYKTEDPLFYGESTSASDYILITQIGGVPAGDTLVINNETHVMIGQEPELLQFIGVNTATIRVFDESRTIEYEGPSSPTPDFTITEGTATTPAIIARTSNSTITSGQTVSVDYEHDENFQVTYVVNDVLHETQRLMDQFRHITADILVKQAIDNPIVYESTIQLKKNARKDVVDPAVRSRVSIELNSKTIGDGSAQSDLIAVVDSTSGVENQVVPITRMGYADGARKIRESVGSSAQRVSSLDLGGNIAYILTEPLDYPTTDGGGLNTEHRGVFQDDEAVSLAASLTDVCSTYPAAFIIGSDGASISGYSDDATLISAGFTDPADLLAERLLRTANHIVISLSGAGIPSDVPENHVYAVSYVCRGDRGPHDLTASAVEFLSLGDATFTYRNG